jgi:hypothetical protein
MEGTRGGIPVAEKPKINCQNTGGGLKQMPL